MYAGSMIENKNFDSIYHEHLCLYTIKSLNNLLKIHNLKIFDCNFAKIHSGSVIAKVCKKDNQKFKETKRYFQSIKKDLKYSKSSFKNFGNKIYAHINKLRKKLYN